MIYYCLTCNKTHELTKDAKLFTSGFRTVEINGKKEVVSAGNCK